MSTYEESFNQADNTTLGPLLTWTELLAGWSTVSNVAYSDGATNTAVRAEHNLDTNDQFCEIVVPAGSTGNLGPAVRHSASAITCYFASCHQTNAQLFKAIAGSFTQLSPPLVIGVAFPWTQRLEVVGTTLRLLINNTEVIKLIDASIDGTTVGGKRFGIQGYAMSGGMGIDSLRAGDLQVPRNPDLSKFPIGMLRKK